METVSGDSEMCFVEAAEDFLDVQICDQDNKNVMRKVFIKVIRKGIDYRQRYQQERETNSNMKKAILAYDAELRRKSETIAALQEELSRVKADLKRSELISRERISNARKYSRLYRKLLKIIDEENSSANSTFEEVDEVNATMSN